MLGLTACIPVVEQPTEGPGATSRPSPRPRATPLPVVPPRATPTPRPTPTPTPRPTGTPVPTAPPTAPPTAAPTPSPNGAARFSAANAILQGPSCVGCHGPGPAIGGSLAFTTEAQWLAARSTGGQAMVSAGSPSTSALFRRLAGNGLGNVDANMPIGPALGAAQISVIRDWIANIPVTPAATPSPTPTPTPSPTPAGTPRVTPIPTAAPTAQPTAAPGASSVRVSWAANREKAVNSAGGGYLVYYSRTQNFAIPGSSFVNVPYVSGASAPTSAVIGNLSAGTYYIKVIAYSSLVPPGSTASATSAPSAEISIRIP